MKIKTPFYNVIIMLMVIVNSITFSQSKSIYLPLDLKKAYDKGTRSYDGKPGPNYWVNKADYKIRAELFPKERRVEGTLQIKYYNNSPDSLRQLFIRLYQDVMRKGVARDFRVDPNDLTDGVEIDTLIIDGKGININERRTAFRNGTNLVIRELSPKIAANSSINIEIKWSLLIPKNSKIRMGAYSDSTLYVAYWYPQIAVYDDLDGWDRQEYTGAVEFYNDINNFDVEITVPKNFIVWGTGLYQNLDEVLKPEIVNKYKEAWESDGIIRIVSEQDLKSGTTLGGEKVIYKFKAENVPDFTFAASSGYIWDGISAEVDLKGTRVLTDAVYAPSVKGFANVAGHAKASVEYLSKEMPGIPFPFPKVTTFNGDQAFGGGMESPMMCNNGVYPSEAGQLGVTLHEIAHTYFPFYMGTNERKYAWMDEGWATYLTYGLVDREYPESKDLEGNIKGLARMMGSESDFPINSLSYAIRNGQLGFISYTKTSLSYHFLREALGDDLFKKALHEYMNRWNGKHPIPYDFFFTFNEVAKEDLSWFWNPWYMEKHYPDLAVKKVSQKGNSLEIVIENVGGVPVPVNLNLTFDDGTNENIKETASLWKKKNSEVTLAKTSNKKIQKVELNINAVPDADKSNNVFEIR